MPKCDFNKVALQRYWNRTLALVFSCKCAAYFQNTFSQEHFWTAASGSIMTMKWQLLFTTWFIEVFLGTGVQIYRRHPCRSAISMKVLCNFIEIALRYGCLNLLHIFRIIFLKGLVTHKDILKIHRIIIIKNIFRIFWNYFWNILEINVFQSKNVKSAVIFKKWRTW